MAMTIGRAAHRSGCSTPTIRYYEEVGLLRPVERTSNGRRAYGWPQVQRLTFIRRARDLGLSIGEVRQLLGISDGDPSACGDARDLLRTHVEEVRRRRLELEQLEAALTRMASRCDGGCAANPSEPCTVFEDIAALPAAR